MKRDDKPVIVRIPKKVIVKTGVIDGANAEQNPEVQSAASIRADKRKRLGFKS